MLEEMDEEFGVSGLIEQTVGNIKKEVSLYGITFMHNSQTLIGRIKWI